jgi:hypothetical protein
MPATRNPAKNLHSRLLQLSDVAILDFDVVPRSRTRDVGQPVDGDYPDNGSEARRFPLVVDCTAPLAGPASGGPHCREKTGWIDPSGE